MLGWGCISVSYLMRRSLNVCPVARILLLLRGTPYPRAIAVFRHDAHLWLLQSDVTAAVIPSVPCNDCFIQCMPYLVAPYAWSFFTGQMKLALVGGRPSVSMLCLDGAPLMCLEMFWTKGGMVTDMRSSAGGLTAVIGWEAFGSVPCSNLSPEKFFLNMFSSNLRLTY